MATETYPCYVKIEDGAGEVVEIPTDQDGILMLTSVKSQFPEAVGLRFKSESSDAWRGVRAAENRLNPPIDGWGTIEYSIVFPKAGMSILKIIISL